MEIINRVSLVLFLLFFCSYIFKLLVLYERHGIKANVLGKKGKDRAIHRAEMFVKVATYIWGLSWLIFSLAERKIERIMGPFIENYFLRLTGVIVIAFGVAVFIVAMISMKASWRVGIDKKTKSLLVTSGIYKYSRNPVFIGFDTMFIGFLITYFNIFTLSLVVLNFVAIHFLILQEERHLGTLFGNEYAQYKEKTPRYILFK